jgi:hypothetical protein
MLGHLVSTRTAPVPYAPAPNRWLARLIAFLLRRP